MKHEPGAPVLVIGGGIGGLTPALSLHQAGLPCRVFEAAPEVKPLGVGINLLPHGTRELTELGLQAARLKATGDLVLTNRTNPPDAILREVWRRTGDRPFARIEDSIARAELEAMSEDYKRVAGFQREALRRRASPV